VALTLALSWAYWLPLAFAGGAGSHFPGLLGPMFAAWIVTTVADGSSGLADLLRRMIRWRVPLRWYGAALIPAIAGVVGLGIQSVIDGASPTLADMSSMDGLPTTGWWATFGLVFVINGFGEEVGWRGVAWPTLRQTRTLGRAALLLTVPWAVWHIPTFWLDTGLRGFEWWLVPGWLVGLASGAVVLGWIIERTAGNLLIPAIFHALLNMFSATPAGEGVSRIVVSTVVIVWAVTILWREHGLDSARTVGRPTH
jgi:membrane protease YdiL (CAAX protease family)